MESQAITLKQPVDYLKILFRRKWFIIVPTLIGIVCSIIAGNMMPKSYEASTLILVEEGRVINPLIQGLAVSTSTAQRLGVLREQILGWDRISQLIKTLNLAKDVRNQWQFEELVKSLRRSIKVNLRGNSIISIAYDGPEPAQAQNIVKTITDIFISENLRQQTKETEDAVSFINDQVTLFQKKLKESEVSVLEDQLDKLLIDSTEKHPMVIELKKKIAAAKGEIESGDYNLDATTLAGGSNSELKELKEDLKKMREEITDTTADGTDGGANRTKMATTSNEKLYKLLLLEKAEQATSKDESVNQKIYDTLLERLETAKITQRLEASKEGTRYTILDPARLPIKPKWPNKPLVLVMGMLAGAMAGIGLVMITEMFDKSFIGIDEARDVLELPIFGATSKIITEEDLKAAKIKNMQVAGLSIVTGVVLVIVIIFNVFIGS